MQQTQQTYLAPIEKPPGFVWKLIYFLSRMQFGKVMTGLKVASVRLPVSFGLFYGKVSKLDQKLSLSLEKRHLVRELVARVNNCEFCIDISRWMGMKSGLSQEKFVALMSYSKSPLFNPAERALLDYVSELTREKRVSPETFQKLAQHYNEREICEIVWLVASEHLYNLSNIGLNIGSDGLSEPAKPA